MNKIFAFLLAICLCLGLCACGVDSSLHGTEKNDKKHTGYANSDDYSQKETMADSSVTSPSQNGDVPNGNADPNGFSTMEALVDAYVTMCNRVISQQEFRRFYPESVWNSGMMDAPFEKQYEDYKANKEKSILNQNQYFGADWSVTWEIVSVEDVTYYGDYTEEDRQKCRDLYGVEPEDHHLYSITICATISGSKNQMTNPGELITVRKLGDKWYMY